MYTALLTLAIVLACASLAVSVYFGVTGAEANFFGARYQKCPQCHRHHFVAVGADPAAPCARGVRMARTPLAGLGGQRWHLRHH